MRYTEEHQWLQPDEDEADVVTVGITEHAAAELGTLTFVALPDVPRTVVRHEEIVTVEGADDTTAIIAPIDGEIVEVNEALIDNPALIEDDPTGDGWLVRIRMADPADLDGMMDEAAYLAFV